MEVEHFKKDELLGFGKHRWTPGRRSNIVLGIFRGVVTMDDVMKTYSLSYEEMNEWFKEVRKSGVHRYFVKFQNPLKGFVV